MSVPTAATCRDRLASEPMKNMFKYSRVVLWIAVFTGFTARAQLSVTVSPPIISGPKAVVPLAIKNHLAENVRSARVGVFLLDEDGKMVAQGTRWVIGGSRETPGLRAGATNVFYFVITSGQPFSTTNLTAKVTFSRVVLESGRLADIGKQVSIQQIGGKKERNEK